MRLREEVASDEWRPRASRSCGVKWREAFAGERIGGWGKERRELAGGEGVEGAEAGGEFEGGQATLAVEPAEEIGGGSLPLFRVALEAAGEEVAVGVAPGLNAGHDMVEGPHWHCVGDQFDCGGQGLCPTAPPAVQRILPGVPARELDRAGGCTFLEFSVGSEAEGFQHAGLHFLG